MQGKGEGLFGEVCQYWQRIPLMPIASMAVSFSLTESEN